MVHDKNGTYFKNRQIAEEIIQWARFLSAHGVNPAFVCEGLTREQSEEYFQMCQQHLIRYGR